MNKDTLGDRMKSYEAVNNVRLLPKSPLFIRIDGKAFHTFTKDSVKPFDKAVIDAMTYAALHTTEHMQGFQLGYVQSDEATFMLTDYDTYETQGWYNYEVNKVVSIAASAFTAHFNSFWRAQWTSTKYVGTGEEHEYNMRQAKKLALFDARAFTVPEADAPNAFIWRQRDWERNSIQMLARAYFTHGECQGKKNEELRQMLIDSKRVDYEDLRPQLKYGTFIEEDGNFSHNKETYETIKARFEEIREKAKKVQTDG